MQVVGFPMRWLICLKTFSLRYITCPFGTDIRSSVSRADKLPMIHWRNAYLEHSTVYVESNIVGTLTLNATGVVHFKFRRV